jgi:hypothetical protein
MKNIPENSGILQHPKSARQKTTGKSGVYEIRARKKNCARQKTTEKSVVFGMVLALLYLAAQGYIVFIFLLADISGM